jgi:hypothetical protein
MTDTAEVHHAATGGTGRRRPDRVRTALRAALVGAGAVTLPVAAWVMITAAMARHELGQTAAGMGRLGTLVAEGKVADARAEVLDLRRHSDRAHLLTTGPAWYLAAAVPYLGDPLDTVRGLTAGVRDLSDTALPALADLPHQVDPRTLITADARVDVAALARAVPALRAVEEAVAAVRSSVAELPRSTWLSAVDNARSSALAHLDALSGTVAGAERLARVLPPMLGQHGSRRYFIGIQNEAESRGTGGLPGAFAVAVATGGRIRLTHFESDSVLSGVSTSLDFGADYQGRYAGADSTNYYGNSNISPHFPYAARIWAAMWQRKSGERVDGAVALDPTALSYLLRVTGPATLADGTKVSAQNIVALTEQAGYARFSDDAARKRYLRVVGQAVGTRLLGGHGDPAALLRAAARAASERRLLVWSADPVLEGALEQTAVAGTVPAGDAPYSGLVVVNVAANKLDYYLDRSLRWQRSGCGGTRNVTVTIVLTNNAPRSGLPGIVTGRSDHPRYPIKPGDNRLLVSYYATKGAELVAATLDGAPTTLSPQRENGHPVYALRVEAPASHPRTLVLNLREPASNGPVTVLHQPLVRPLRVSTSDLGCG